MKTDEFNICSEKDHIVSARMTMGCEAEAICEVYPCNIPPTNSAIVALGNALCCALMKARNFTLDDFARFHPAGQPGPESDARDVFHPLPSVACVKSDSGERNIVAMKTFPLSAACVLGENETLKGIITDGDLRWALRQYDNIRDLCTG